jgi:hypothetical protein
MSQTEGYEEDVEKDIAALLFTDFDGKFKARLSAVIPNRNYTNFGNENAPISSKYDCRIKVAYHKDIMSLLEEGMIFAVRNFKSKKSSNDGNTKYIERFTLLVASRIWPEHYGLRALSDHTYYPMQFEVIEQSVADWDTEDKSTMMVQISAIPINYDLIINREKGNRNGKIEYQYTKGFSYPIIGDNAFLLNPDTVSNMYNQKVLSKMEFELAFSGENNEKSHRIGVMKVFEDTNQEISLYVNFNNLVRYHFGIFSFTGGGKSNLLSNLIRKILLFSSDTKIVIFDISSEYPFLLMDILADNSVESKVILESPASSADEFFLSVVKPREYEDDQRVKKGLSKVFEKGNVTHYVKPQSASPVCKDVLMELDALRNESIGKPHYLDAISDIKTKIIECMVRNKLQENDLINQEFAQLLISIASEAMKSFKINTNASLYGWAMSRDSLLNRLRLNETDGKNDGNGRSKNKSGITTDQLIETIEGTTRLTCLSISDPYTIKELAISLSSEFLYRRKRQFKVKPYVLFVFDEAQEFVRDLTNARGTDKECSEHIETLLRQGRKYGLGGCIATQRIAYLNTSALQQLHTYFVGTLPRPYDRNTVSNTFTIDNGILEKTLEFAPGDWLLSSYIATGIENVPIFIRADNSEKKIESFLVTLS